MAVYFLDTSAAVKRYVSEAGSPWITTLTELASGNLCWLADVTAVEMTAAFYRRARTGTLTLAQAQGADWIFRHEQHTHYQLVQVTPDLLSRAMDLAAKHPLRAYDAIQLASVLHVQVQGRLFGTTDPTFISADHSLNQVAAAEGLAVENPNQHP